MKYHKLSSLKQQNLFHASLLASGDDQQSLALIQPKHSSLPVSSQGRLLSVWLSALHIKTPVVLKATLTPLQSDLPLTNYSCSDYFLVKLLSVELGLTTSKYLFFFFLKAKDAIQLTALIYS